MASDSTSAWTCQVASEPLVVSDVPLPPLKDTEVEVRIICCGICASDIDAVKGKYGALYKFPMVPGHEGVGIVTRVGGLVRTHSIGDRVGVGVYRWSCSCCRNCSRGLSNLCPTKEMMFMNNWGAFSEYLRIDARSAFKIPDAIESADAAVLMCAGTTVFAPFREWNIKGGDRVGVVGIGGLGHLALIIGRAMGCDMYALSSSPDKEEDVRKLGGKFIHATPDNLKANANFFDYILVTAANSNLDWVSYFRALGAGGKMILMGVSFSEVKIPQPEFILGQKTIAGSAAGSSALTMELLEFAAANNIKPWVETFPFDQVNEVIEKVSQNQVRFRAVLVRSEN